MLTTRTFASSFARRTRAMWPPWRSPMVGTSATRRPLRRDSRRALRACAQVRTISTIGSSPADSHPSLPHRGRPRLARATAPWRSFPILRRTAGGRAASEPEAPRIGDGAPPRSRPRAAPGGDHGRQRSRHPARCSPRGALPSKLSTKTHIRRKRCAPSVVCGAFAGVAPRAY